jgi:undecaprenyl-diphosphatase
MDAIHLIVLGAVEGLTEFVPISSSGHLIIARSIFGLQSADGLSIDAVLQLSAALALFIYFRKDFWALIQDTIFWIIGKSVAAKQKVLILAIILGSVPAGILGLLLEKRMETTFRSVEIVAYTLIAGSLLMIFAERWGSRIQLKRPLSVWRGIQIGFYQCLALVPGISRSGATISGGLILGLSREEAARFGFLLSFPIIFASGLLKLYELIKGGEFHSFGSSIVLGMMASFAFGLASIHYLLKYLRSHSLWVFIAYRFLVALAILWILYV